MSIKVGQKILAPAILGSVGMGGYSAVDRYGNDNPYADPKQSAITGGLIGGAIGTFGVTREVSSAISKKVSQFTSAQNIGASEETAKMFSRF